MSARAVTDYDPQVVHETADIVTAAGGQTLPLAVNVLEEDSIADVITANVSEYGAVHVLCKHVGGCSSRADLDLLRMDMDESDRAVALNMRSTLLGSPPPGPTRFAPAAALTSAPPARRHVSVT
ncbi:SDR family oxidoreductase [Streptomyces sp. PU-14G]|uniref:SDR family oxidoreductase n=1 Tax=Streptomyces sp. PU-14G TaxID=2800808 RepID=UPI0034DE9978